VTAVVPGERIDEFIDGRQVTGLLKVEPLWIPRCRRPILGRIGVPRSVFRVGVLIVIARRLVNGGFGGARSPGEAAEARRLAHAEALRADAARVRELERRRRLIKD
jgi:hypothetical protein